MQEPPRLRHELAQALHSPQRPGITLHVALAERGVEDLCPLPRLGIVGHEERRERGRVEALHRETLGGRGTQMHQPLVDLRHSVLGTRGNAEVLDLRLDHQPHQLVGPDADVPDLRDRARRGDKKGAGAGETDARWDR